MKRTPRPKGLRPRWAAAIALAASLAACAGAAPGLPPPPVHPDGQTLWTILHDHCVPDQLSQGQPAPCALVDLAGGEAHGFVVLKDRDGASQYLLMPTAKITGIEDPAILAPGAPNYFAQAWGQRHLVEARLGRPLAADQLAVAVNSQYGRSQDQLHLHIDCLDASVGAALNAAAAPRDGRWTAIVLKGHRYRLRWLDANALARTNPFALLAAEQPGARRQMGAWALALVGASEDGFYLLADRADPALGDPASAEELQDHRCRP
ncbi:MAG TPA: CDP-diacylglycerol diphosphatase [Caulobacteraceae bacterium]|nr:CDP-diacylglycerol diphosphatase [Caulobacteraceae bacterium]